MLQAINKFSKNEGLLVDL